MTNYTENYNLIKPAETDYYDIADFNANADIIDGALSAHEQAIIDLEISCVGKSPHIGAGGNWYTWIMMSRIMLIAVSRLRGRKVLLVHPVHKAKQEPRVLPDKTQTLVQ